MSSPIIFLLLKKSIFLTHLTLHAIEAKYLIPLKITSNVKAVVNAARLDCRLDQSPIKDYELVMEWIIQNKNDSVLGQKKYKAQPQPLEMDQMELRLACSIEFESYKLHRLDFRRG